jgi:hypothetical protein
VVYQRDGVAALLRVHDTTIADLRNNIVHKYAYRPSLSETQAVVDDSRETIGLLTRHFDLRTDNYHLNECIDGNEHVRGVLSGVERRDLV